MIDLRETIIDFVQMHSNSLVNAFWSYYSAGYYMDGKQDPRELSKMAQKEVFGSKQTGCQFLTAMKENSYAYMSTKKCVSAQNILHYIRQNNGPASYSIDDLIQDFLYIAVVHDPARKNNAVKSPQEVFTYTSVDSLHSVDYGTVFSAYAGNESGMETLADAFDTYITTYVTNNEGLEQALHEEAEYTFSVLQEHFQNGRYS